MCQYVNTMCNILHNIIVYARTLYSYIILPQNKWDLQSKCTLLYFLIIPASNTEGTPMVAAPQPKQKPPVQEMEKEVLQAESYLHSDEEDDDELPSPTPSNEDMDEYRLRLHAVESGSQRRVKSQIVAEKVEIEI